MGRRRINAPRRGSLAYLPRGRAANWIARIRNWPEVINDKPKFLGLPGYKVGMSFVYVLGDVRGNPTFGQEIHRAITIVETPPMIICAYRSYKRTTSGLKSSTEVWAKKLPRGIEKFLTLPKKEAIETAELEEESLAEVRAIVATQPRTSGVRRKKPELVEIKVGGGRVKDQLEYLNKLLGKNVSASEIFEEGQYIDVGGITKGKGIQGPVRRFGVKTKQHKSRKTVRELGTLGAWTPHYVMYTVPRAGQTGFHQRVEYNKRILKVGTAEMVVNPKSGFQHYGAVRNTYLVVSGSLPGPSRRTLILRHAIRPPKMPEVAVPKVIFSGLEVAGEA
jgi:large subunit ribosomal protein L3